jgi:hypothetical protein
MKHFKARQTYLLFILILLNGFLITGCETGHWLPTGTGPTVTFTVPANNATGVAVNTKISATFSDVMDPNTITTTTFTLQQGTTVIPGTVAYSGVTAVFTPASNLAANTTYTATIKKEARNPNRNELGNDYVWSFTTGAAPDTTAPTVTHTINANGATGVSVNTKIAATFSEAMDPLTITAATFTFKQGTTDVPGSVTYSGVTAVFTPASTLAANTTYTGTITTGAKDLTGNALASNYVWSWTTGALPDTTKPTVILTIPINAAAGVPINTKVSATFSKGMDPLTITNLTFSLKQGTTVVPGTVVYSGVIAVFTPLSLLAANTTFTATITTGAKDLAGNALASDYTWSFSTGAASDIIAPSIIAEIYGNGATAVPINTRVVAMFSKVMDPLTITNLTFTLKQGTTVIPGTVTSPYPGDSAIFKSLSDLSPNTTYTAAVTTGVKDLAGNVLIPGLLPNPWSFTTGAIPIPPVPGPALLVDLGTVAPFAIISGSGISSVPSSTITGNIGVSPAAGTAITGQTCGDVTGTIYTVTAAGPACRVIDAAGLTAAKAALTVAYNDAAGRTSPAPATVSGDQGGLTLAPGIYKSTSSLSIASGDLTLDGQGDATAVWIFQIASTLTTVGCGASVPCATGGNVKLIRGADAANIFWQVGTAATIGQYTQFYGTILAHDDISVNTGARINGRLLSGAQPSGAGAVTLIGDTIVKP